MQRRRVTAQAVFAVTCRHTRSLVGVGAICSISCGPHTVSSLQVRSLVAVGAVDSNPT